MSVTFYYGTMGSGKSTALLQLNYSLKESGFKPLLIKPEIDTRDIGVIKSRIGLEEPCHLVSNKSFIKSKLELGTTHILVDEAQFLDKFLIDQLFHIADTMDIEVICYGLRTSYTGKLFEGSAMLFALADDLIELPHIYSDGRKRVAHILTIDGEPVFDGDPIHVGDTEYESVSRKRYNELKHKYYKMKGYD